MTTRENTRTDTRAHAESRHYRRLELGDVMLPADTPASATATAPARWESDVCTLALLAAATVTRADVRAGRDGWITDKRSDSLVGLVRADTNAAGEPIWRAHAGDVGSFAFKRDDAIATVIELHNMQEKARAYDRLARRFLTNQMGVSP
jgi:hypothetical protein